VAGLHIGVAPTRRFSAAGVAQSAERLGVGVQSLDEHGLALGYGAIETTQVEQGIRRLKQAIIATCI
jgi:DNA-binding transcriptional MocR family regulator